MTNTDQPRGNSTSVDGRTVHNPGAFAPATQSAPEVRSLLAPTVNTSNSVQYTGQEDSMMIAYGTDVWLKDADGKEADLETLLAALPVDLTNLCEGCEGSPVIGARAPSNGPSEVERCDTCETFAGDFEAAQAVAARLGEGFTTWFEPAGSDE
jgi:hypothetical protein